MKKSPARLVVRLLIAAAAIAGVLLFVRSRTRADAKATATKDAAAAVRAVPVLVTGVEQRDVPVWLEGLGTVAAIQQVTVRAQVDGRLDEVFFREGQTVHKGDLIAQIDPRPFTVQLHQAEGALARDRAQLDSGKKNLVRYRALRETNLIAQQQVDDQIAAVGQIEGTVKVDLAAVESARLNLDYARVRSPIDGIVGVRVVDAGNLVRAADAGGLVVVAQLDPAAVLVTLPEDDLVRVNAALVRGEVTVEAWSRDGATRLGTGKLALVDNQINQATATLKLKAFVPNPEHKLWPNQFVKARILVDQYKSALVAPAAAVQRGPQGTFVYVVGEDKTAQLRLVEVALITGDTALLARGLSAGEQVVVEGQGQLRPGAQVAARPAGDDKKGAGDDKKGGGKKGGGKAGGGKDGGGALNDGAAANGATAATGRGRKGDGT